LVAGTTEGGVSLADRVISVLALVTILRVGAADVIAGAEDLSFCSVGTP
jgi:hypothetical protein